MSRRVEITVPNDWADPVRECLEDSDKCNLGAGSGRPNMLTEVKGLQNTVFYVTVPGPAVASILEVLRKNGIGVSVGRIVLTSLEYLKPDLSRPLQWTDAADSGDKSGKDKSKKPPPLKGYQHFQKARKTTEELYNEISNGANMNVNTWLNLVGASMMAAGGLASNAVVFIVAAMLVSPIMGPILGMTFGYRVADWPLFKAGVISELKMAATCFCCGALYGLVLGDVGKTFAWPTDAMLARGQTYVLIVSILVSAAAGVVLAVSLTSTGGNALVGTAISAGLLPPIVNAGMLVAYSFTYAPIELQAKFYEMGNYALVFYSSHVVTIIVVANIVFWLKDVNPKFRDGEDTNFDDIPSLVAHKERLLATGQTNSERGKAEFFAEHIKDDLKDIALDVKDKVTGFASLVTGGLIPRNNKSQPVGDEDYIDGTGDIEMNSGVRSRRRRSFEPINGQDEQDDEAMVGKIVPGGLRRPSTRPDESDVGDQRNNNKNDSIDNNNNDEQHGGNDGAAKNKVVSWQSSRDVILDEVANPVHGDKL